MFPSANSSGTELFLDSLVSIDPLHRDFGDVVLHGGPVGVHDRNAGIGRMARARFMSPEDLSAEKRQLECQSGRSPRSSIQKK
jgi:hypothetical protein